MREVPEYVKNVQQTISAAGYTPYLVGGCVRDLLRGAEPSDYDMTTDALPEELMAEYTRRLGFYSCTVPAFEQYVLAEFINGGELERYINRRRRILRQEKKEK